MREPTREEWKDWAAGIEKPEPKYSSPYSLLSQLIGMSNWAAAQQAANLQAQMFHGLQQCPYCGHQTQHAGLGHLLGGILGI